MLKAIYLAATLSDGGYVALVSLIVADANNSTHHRSSSALERQASTSSHALVQLTSTLDANESCEEALLGHSFASAPNYGSTRALVFRTILLSRLKFHKVKI